MLSIENGVVDLIFITPARNGNEDSDPRHVKTFALHYKFKMLKPRGRFMVKPTIKKECPEMRILCCEVLFYRFLEFDRSILLNILCMTSLFFYFFGPEKGASEFPSSADLHLLNLSYAILTLRRIF